jgi:nitroimidazol reductase NimA-like FMN-containing flavoprotein (pyridoxamine 5'-phosphate oxidase superfamily)
MNTELIHAFLNFVKAHRLSSIATVSTETGGPQMALVYYVLDATGNIYFATTEDSRKVKNIRKNSKVAVIIGEEVDPEVAQIEGHAELVMDMNERMDLLVRISAVANQNPNSLNLPPLVKLLQRSDMAIVKITIDTFKFSDFSRDDHFVVEGTQKDLLAL